MASTLRVCLFDRSGSETTMRPAFERTPGIMIVGTTSSWEELRDWVRHANLDIIAVNLDAQPEQDLESVHRLVEISPSCGLVGISKRTDPSSIIAAMRAGCSQFVCSPIDQDDLNNAIGRMRATRMSATGSSKRVCVIGSSGGAGATSIACNLAMELAHVSDRRCGLVDLNLEFGDVACAFNCSPRFSLTDACQDGTELDRMLLGKALHELPCNVSILARPEHIEDAVSVTPEGVQEMLRVLSEMLPFVVIDLPRSFSFISAAALRNADKVLIVTQLAVPFIRNASRIYECLRSMDTPEEAIEIVLNRCKSGFERITPDDVEEHFGKPVFAMVPNDYRRVQTALDLGHPIVADAPNTPARLAIQQMAHRIAGVETADQDSAATGGGLFSRFWSKGRKSEARAERNSGSKSDGSPES